MPEESLILTLCLEEDTILVSNAVFERLGHPRLIQMLINDERRSILIQPCEYGAREAIVIPDEPMYQFETRGHSLLRRIRRLTGWSDNTPRVLYGRYIPNPSLIIFDLNNAQLAELQPLPEDCDCFSEDVGAGDIGFTEQHGGMPDSVMPPGTHNS